MTPTDDGGTPASASSATRRFTAVASAALDALRELSYASLPLQQGGRQQTCRGFCCEAAVDIQPAGLRRCECRLDGCSSTQLQSLFEIM